MFSRIPRRLAAVLTAVLVAAAVAAPAAAHPDHDDGATAKNVPVPRTEAERQFALVEQIELNELRSELRRIGPTPCEGGRAAGYSCDGVDLIALLPLSSLGGGSGNDLWGWTHQKTGREFAIMGRSTGVTFVEVTDPRHPVVVGTLASHSFASIWRDLKVYADHLYIVSEAQGSGLQVFDLRSLLKKRPVPHTFTETSHLAAWSNAHNIAINESSGFAYVVGSDTCSGGLRMVNLASPADPKVAGCFAADGYTHDVQCVDYAGPDIAYTGREICFASNEDTLTIVDVTDKANPVQLARKAYAGVGYSHQGWLTPDHRFFVSDDELDELSGAPLTRSYVWDVTDLDNPAVDFTFTGSTGAIDHNQYIRRDRSYQANYKAGLRIIDLSSLDSATATEVAYFDTFPQNDGVQFDGAWTAFPFYRADVVAVSTMDRGLFLLGYAGEDGSVSVADLDNRSVQAFQKRWKAIATVEIRDEGGHPVQGAKVTIRWSNGKRKTCVTGPNGRCQVSVLRYNKFAKVNYRVLDVEFDDANYASWRNADSDGDSNGLRDMVRRP